MAVRMSEDVRSIYITGLRNAHAVEHQAQEIMERQVERLKNYPDVEARLRQHIAETEVQRKRLESILASHDEKPSSLKDAALSFMGSMTALTHAPASDEILKNSFANFAFENYEIAIYKSLIAMAEACGDMQAMPMLKQSLSEEQAMAAWIDERLQSVTMAYLQREEQGVTAGR